MSTRLLAFAPLLLSACMPAPSAPVIRDARIVVSPMGGAAYFTVENKGGEDRLIDVDTPGIGKASMHATTQNNGVMRMRGVDSLDVPANGTLTLKPGGNHIMIMGEDIPAGGQATLVLTFEKAGRFSVDAPIEGVQQTTHGEH